MRIAWMGIACVLAAGCYTAHGEDSGRESLHIDIYGKSPAEAADLATEALCKTHSECGVFVARCSEDGCSAELTNSSYDECYQDFYDGTVALFECAELSPAQERDVNRCLNTAFPELCAEITPQQLDAFARAVEADELWPAPRVFLAPECETVRSVFEQCLASVSEPAPGTEPSRPGIPPPVFNCSAPCTCPDGTVGSQYCLADGTLGPCECPESGVAGSGSAGSDGSSGIGGSGGTSGSGGSAGSGAAAAAGGGSNTLTGFVRNLLDEAPVEGVVIRALDNDTGAPLGLETLSGPDGAFVLTGLPDGLIGLLAVGDFDRAPERVDTYMYYIESSKRDLNVYTYAAAFSSLIDNILGPSDLSTGAVSGAVYYEEAGERYPIDCAIVEAEGTTAQIYYLNDAGLPDPMLAEHTTANGRFYLSGIDSGLNTITISIGSRLVQTITVPVTAFEDSTGGRYNIHVVEIVLQGTAGDPTPDCY